MSFRGHSAKVEMYLRIPVHAVLQDEATVRWKDIELVSVVDGDVYGDELDRVTDNYSRAIVERDEARKLAGEYRDHAHTLFCTKVGQDPSKTSKMLLPWEDMVNPILVEEK